MIGLEFEVKKEIDEKIRKFVEEMREYDVEVNVSDGIDQVRFYSLEEGNSYLKCYMKINILLNLHIPDNWIKIKGV